MSARAKQFILRAARAIIKSNSASTVRKRLKGNLHERGQATKRLTDLIFQLRVTGDGRSWSGRGSADSAVHEMRQQASDSRLPAAIRCRAVINLAVYEGFLPVSAQIGAEVVGIRTPPSVRRDDFLTSRPARGSRRT
jgi:hypothetical protein